MRETDLKAIGELAGAFKSFRGLSTIVASSLSVASLYLLPESLKLTGLAFGLVLTALGLITAFFTRYISQTLKRRLAIAAVALAAIAATVFLVCSLTWVFEVDGTAYVAGMNLTPDAQRAIDQRLVPNHRPALLNFFGHYSEDRIWEGRSATKAALVTSFGFFCALIATAFCLWTLDASASMPQRGI